MCIGYIVGQSGLAYMKLFFVGMKFNVFTDEQIKFSHENQRQAYRYTQ